MLAIYLRRLSHVRRLSITSPRAACNVLMMWICSSVHGYGSGSGPGSIDFRVVERAQRCVKAAHGGDVAGPGIM
jgi:hypothetical protein